MILYFTVMACTLKLHNVIHTTGAYPFGTAGLTYSMICVTFFKYFVYLSVEYTLSSIILSLYVYFVLVRDNWMIT